MGAPTPGRYGLMPAPPPGKMWVRNPEVGWALSIRAGVARYEAVGQQVPEHLAVLAAGLPKDLPDTSTELVDSDFGIPPAPYGSAQPLGAAPREPDAQPSLWDVEEAQGVDLEGWTVAELKDALDQVGVEYPANARKSELIALLEEVEQ